jgi:hypothetical protein
VPSALCDVVVADVVGPCCQCPTEVRRYADGGGSEEAGPSPALCDTLQPRGVASSCGADAAGHSGNGMDSLTIKDAYAAMYAFLTDVYRRTGSDDVGVLLGGMSVLPDGGSADPAAWADWEAAVRRVKEGKVDTALGLQREP